MNGYNHEEITSILDRYGDMIYRIAFIQMKNPDMADDVYQEVCIRLLKQKKKLQNEEHTKAWLIRTTVHCCRDSWKSAWSQKVTLGRDDDQSDLSDTTQNEAGWVTQCVQSLPEKYRIIIHLYYYEDYRQKEIAQILKMNENTVASRLSRGRNMLKKILKQGGVVYEL